MIYAPRHHAAQGQEPLVKPAFHMKSDRNGRIDGSVPVFGQAANKAEEFARSLETDIQSPKNALTPQASEEAKDPVGQDSSFGFFDFLDIINPLQHIPIVASIYRHITGDQIGPVAEVIGGGIFGGPIGAAAGLASAVVTHETGKDVGENVMGLFAKDHSGLEGTTIALADLSHTRSPYNS